MNQPMTRDEFERWAKEIKLDASQWMPVWYVVGREYDRGRRAATLDWADAQALLAVTGWNRHPPHGPLRALYDRLVAVEPAAFDEQGERDAR